MNDKNLACFAAAARSGSFSAAAGELYLSQQSVSYGVRNLERELGFPLFVRRAQCVELTPWGERFRAWYEDFDCELRRTAEAGGDPTPCATVTDVQLRCLLAAAAQPEPERAAESLYYTPQRLSENLAQLEKALGLRLVERERGLFRLTERGAAYAELFAAAGRSLRAVAEQARQSYERAGRTAVLGVSEWLDTRRLLGPALEAMPDAGIELRTLPNRALLDALESGAVDAAFWSENHAPANRGLVFTEVAEEELCCYLPEGDGAWPLLLCPGWPRSRIENSVISAQETVFGDFHFRGAVLTDSLEELRTKLYEGGYAAVGDRRFGTLGEPPGLRALPIGARSHILAGRRPGSDGDCAAELIRRLRAAVVGGTKN